MKIFPNGYNPNIEKTAAKYLVVDNAFNRENYPDLVGKILDSPPAYAQVKEVNYRDIAKTEKQQESAS